jgi:hypothetical protein
MASHVLKAMVLRLPATALASCFAAGKTVRAVLQVGGS